MPTKHDHGYICSVVSIVENNEILYYEIPYALFILLTSP
jgi:hypothetical protein